MPLFIETYRSSKTPWEVFREVYARSPTCFFLDSPNPGDHFLKENKSQNSPHHVPLNQAYSYIGMDPALEVRLDRDMIHLEGEMRGKYPAKQLFPVLKKILKKYGHLPPAPHPFFTGGLAGYFGYELAPYCDKIRFRPKKELGIPELYLGLFRDVIVYDHKKGVYYLATNDERRTGKMKTYFEKSITKEKRHFRLKQFTPEMTKGRFESMVKRAKEYIAAGDIYQANLSQRFSFECSGSTLDLYGKLRAINPSPFSCFLKIRDLEVISSSPERLIRKKGNLCETRPIAGTCPVHGSKQQPRLWRKQLLQNEKEKAEHLMLVDLERNDLGRVCDYRSVKVEDFMVLEKYSHVVHIVSKITGKLRKGKDALDVVKAMFPGGTITGCPKIRCMQIIDELEPVRRGIYTGSIGYIGLDGDMDLNIVIRTLVLRKNKGHLQVGAGIVYDSDPAKEYKETLHKGEALVKALVEASAGQAPKPMKATQQL